MRAVAHGREELMSLALLDPSVRWKRHESVMDSAMNTVLGRGSAMRDEGRKMVAGWSLRDQPGVSLEAKHVDYR